MSQPLYGFIELVSTIDRLFTGESDGVFMMSSDRQCGTPFVIIAYTKFPEGRHQLTRLDIILRLWTSQVHRVMPSQYYGTSRRTEKLATRLKGRGCKNDNRV